MTETDLRGSYGELQLTSPLTAECRALEQIFLVAVARQSGTGVDPKEARIPVAVNLPGDVLNPVFDPAGYSGIIRPLGVITLDDGLAGVQADGGDDYLDSEIEYSIDEESESGFEIAIPVLETII